MSTNVRRMDCPPEDVFGVFANGWLFAGWVVGASRLREVDAAWPREGAKLAHSFGAWPFVIDDETTSLEWDPPRRFVLQPKGWPLGEARVEIDVRPRGDGCVVRMRERAVKGPGSWIPGPLLDLPLWWRNRETLHRLQLMAERGAGRPAASAGDAG